MVKTPPIWVQAACALASMVPLAWALPQEQDGRQLGVGLPGGPFRQLDGVETQRFLKGRRVFNRAFNAGSGLGTPELNADSCRACHQDPVLGGAGGLELNVFRFARDEGGMGPFQDLDGGQVASKLRPPWVDGRENYDDSLADVFEQRQTPTLFGAGLIDSIYDDSILANADPDDRDGDGIRGLARWVPVSDSQRRIEDDGAGQHRMVVEELGGTHLELGRFGWKNQIPSLLDFMHDAMAGETGITTPPDGRGFGLTADADDVADPELSPEDMENLFFFVSLLSPPVRTKNDPQGEELFSLLGCASCHVPSLEGSFGPVELYSDLLLHNIMPDDFRGMEERGAPVGYYRTPPLWGIRDTAPYLHDGRGEDLRGAIGHHDGEARKARIRFEALAPDQQDALLAFLRSL